MCVCKYHAISLQGALSCLLGKINIEHQQRSTKETSSESTGAIYFPEVFCKHRFYHDLINQDLS